MKELNADYLFIMKYGLLRARDAAYEASTDRVRAETEHLHEIPTLISESNLHRHQHYLKHHRGEYIDWYERHRPDLLDEVRKLFDPIWHRMMEKLLAEIRRREAAGEELTGVYTSERDF